MEILREMVQVLTKYKTKQIEVLGNPTENKSQVYEFYEGIADGTFTSDEEAATHFFDGNVRNQSYKNLKSRLKNRLINTVFFVEANQSMFNEYERAYVNCYRDWAAARILASKSAKKSAADFTPNYYLNYPNKEVRLSFIRYIIAAFVGKDEASLLLRNFCF
ncbi:MAG: hypothetical protein AB8G86_16095 [Saprospiraceae bacterium]